MAASFPYIPPVASIYSMNPRGRPKGNFSGDRQVLMGRNPQPRMQIMTPLPAFDRARAVQALQFTLLFVACCATAIAAGDPAKGKEAYSQRCAACHSIEYNGTGPAHHGLIGRKAGAVPGFPYSAALKASTVTWTDETLDQWLADPEKFIPGQKMWVTVPDSAERRNIIEYLKAASGRG